MAVTGKKHHHRATASDFTFEHGSFLQARHLGRQTVFLDACKRDRRDARAGLERERKFTVSWRRLSTNHIWADSNGAPVVLFEDSVQQYKKNQKVWPLGRCVHEISPYSQIWNYFLFTWRHTRPYKTVGLIILMAASRPVQNLTIGYIATQIEADPKGVPAWLYFVPLFILGIERTMNWWYQINVPLNSQRYQLRCVLLTQRVQLSDSHPLAHKWPAGRFNGLLRDVDELVNGVWGTCLIMIEELITIIWTTLLCLINLASTIGSETTPIPTIDYGIYVALFLGLGFLTMTFPFLWFRFFRVKFKECETMVRDGQALYLSAAANAVMVDPELSDIEIVSQTRGVEGPHSLFTNNEDKRTGAAEAGAMTTTGKRAFRVFGLATFRSFFLRLAWTTNYSLIIQATGAAVAYFLLTAEGFGESFNLTSTLIVLLSLKDFSAISIKLLDEITLMSRGCLVLGDVAELLNSESDTAKNDESPINRDNPMIVKDEEYGEEGDGEQELLKSDSDTAKNDESSINRDSPVIVKDEEYGEEVDGEQELLNSESDTAKNDESSINRDSLLIVKDEEYGEGVDGEQEFRNSEIDTESSINRDSLLIVTDEEYGEGIEGNKE
jgi:hypothetical protein